MEKYLTSHSDSGELIKLKKSLQLIKEVLRTYAGGTSSHIGLSCALAVSKTEELKTSISPSCPAYHSFTKLIDALRALYEGKNVQEEVQRQLEAINAYFDLDRYSLVLRGQAMA